MHVYICTVSLRSIKNIYIYIRTCTCAVIYCTYTYASPIVYIARIHVPQYLHVCNVKMTVMIALVAGVGFIAGNCQILDKYWVVELLPN